VDAEAARAGKPLVLLENDLLAVFLQAKVGHVRSAVAFVFPVGCRDLLEDQGRLRASPSELGGLPRHLVRILASIGGHTSPIRQPGMVAQQVIVDVVAREQLLRLPPIALARFRFGRTRGLVLPEIVFECRFDAGTDEPVGLRVQNADVAVRTAIAVVPTMDIWGCPGPPGLASYLRSPSEGSSISKAEADRVYASSAPAGGSPSPWPTPLGDPISEYAPIGSECRG